MNKVTQHKLHILSLVLSLLFAFISEDVVADTDDIMNKSLEAIAELTEERALNLVIRRINRTLRPKLCGYHPYYLEHEVNEKFDEYIVHNSLKPYFHNTCKALKHAIDQNVFIDSEFVRSIRADLVHAGVDAVFEKYYPLKKEDIPSSNLLDEVKTASFIKTDMYLDSMEVDLLKLHKKLHEKKFKYLKTTKRLMFELLESKFSATGNKAIYPNLLLTIGKQNLSQYNISSNGAPGDPTNAKNRYLFSKNGIRFDIVNATDLFKAVVLHELIGTYKNKIYQSDLYMPLVDIQAVYQDIEANLHQLSDLIQIIHDRRSSRLHYMFAEMIDRHYSKIELAGNAPSDAIRIVRTISQIVTNDSSKDNIKGALSSYVAELDSFTVRYDDFTMSLGTIVGTGSTVKDSNEESDRSLAAYAPFGLIVGRKSVGAMVHIFDIGEYFVNENANSDPEWQDAISPGVAVFWRPTKGFPIVIGVDYTRIGAHKDSQGMLVERDETVRIFLGMQIDLFHLN